MIILSPHSHLFKQESARKDGIKFPCPSSQHNVWSSHLVTGLICGVLSCPGFRSPVIRLTSVAAMQIFGQFISELNYNINHIAQLFFLLQAANRESSSHGVSLSHHSRGNIAAAVPDAQLGYGGQNWAELVFQAVPQSLQPMPVDFIQSPDYQFFTPYKLPVSYKSDF